MPGEFDVLHGKESSHEHLTCERGEHDLSAGISEAWEKTCSSCKESRARFGVADVLKGREWILVLCRECSTNSRPQNVSDGCFPTL